MSDDERDIDVELDDGDLCDEGSIVYGEDGLPENKRALHNAMERKRRDSIKDSFRGLQECIPTLKGDKTSRAQVLKKTGDYIVHMQKKINNHQQEIQELKQQNNQLESQIRALEKAKMSGNFACAGDLLQVESLVPQEDLELETIEGAELVYDDTSSDTSDCQVQTGMSVHRGTVKSLQPARMAVSLPTVPGVTVSLPPASAAAQPLGQQMTVVQPGQSLLAASALRVQPGQSLLLSEPLRKKMKF